MKPHTITLEQLAGFTPTVAIAAAHGGTDHKRLEVRVDLPTETTRFVVATEGQEHFFDNLAQAITCYNEY
jgi:hypothetical protein